MMLDTSLYIDLPYNHYVDTGERTYKLSYIVESERWKLDISDHNKRNTIVTFHNVSGYDVFKCQL